MTEEQEERKLKTKDLLQFYPTPKELAQKMALKLGRRFNYILDPSAGEGSLLNAVKNLKDRFDERKFYAIEIDDYRAYKLSDYRLIGGDFLSFNPNGLSFDGIIMNPPFNKGIEHFIKALDLLDDGGRLVCLLNANSLNGSNENKKRVMRIIEDLQGEVEYLKAPFEYSERKTLVDCVLITIDKPKRERFFEDEFYLKLEDDLSSEEFGLDFCQPQGNGLIKHDVVKSLVARYNLTRKNYAELLRSLEKVNYNMPCYVRDKDSRESSIKGLKNYNEFIEDLRFSCWSEAFRLTKINDVLTSEMKNEILNIQGVVSNKEFTIKNINEALCIIIQNRDKITKTSIVNLFNKWTKYNKDNRLIKEGWKTNDFWRVNKKIIMPNAVGDIYFPERLDYRQKEALDDIDRTLCLMSGLKYEESGDTIANSLQGNDRKLNEYNTWYESQFFESKFFKKRTLHMKFKSEKVWSMFNRLACKGKMWLGCETNEDCKSIEDLADDGWKLYKNGEEKSLLVEVER